MGEYNTFLPKVRGVLSEPVDFFSSVKDEPLSPAFKYYAIISIIPIAITYVLLSFFGAFYNPMAGGMGMDMGAGALLSLGLVAFIALYVLLLVISFVGTAFIHIFAILLRCHGGYKQTYKALVYGMTPQTLFSWIPIINIIAMLYSFYLEIKGMSILHDVSMGRAFVVLIMPLIIIFVIFVAFLAMMLSMATMSGVVHTIM